MSRSFLYDKIKQELVARIEQEIYCQGDKLPSEAQLVKEYGISRNTASRVLNDLVSEGYARRRQGKGTFVHNKKIDATLDYIAGMTDIFELNQKHSTTKVICYEVVAPNERVRRHLNLDEDGKALRVYRVRYADGEPAIINESFRSYDRFPNLISYDPTTVLSYRYLRKIKNIYVVEVQESLEIALLNPEEARLLNQKVGTPAFLVKTVSTDNTNQPLEVTRSLFRADMFQFTMNLHNKPSTIEDSEEPILQMSNIL